MNELRGSDVCRINALIKTAKTDELRTVLKYASSTFPLIPAGIGSKGRPRSNGERLHSGTLSLVGWSDAAYGDLSQNGKCRLGYLIGIMSSSLSGPRHVLQWTSKFTRKLVKSSLGGEVYAFSETIDHVALLREFYAPFSRLSPGLVGMGDCESLFTHLKNKKMVTEKYLVRHFLSIQQFIEEGDLDNAYRAHYRD